MYLQRKLLNEEALETKGNELFFEARNSSLFMYNCTYLMFFRYETKDFQAKVRENYNKLIDKSYWTIINTDAKSQDEVFKEIKDVIEDVTSKPIEKPIETLWPMDD